MEKGHSFVVKLRCLIKINTNTGALMSIVNTLALESNRKIKINFDGGDLSSDAGLLLIKEFVNKLGIEHFFIRPARATRASKISWQPGRIRSMQSRRLPILLQLRTNTPLHAALTTTGGKNHDKPEHHR